MFVSALTEICNYNLTILRISDNNSFADEGEGAQDTEFGAHNSLPGPM
jgi:hypothetical protein